LALRPLGKGTYLRGINVTPAGLAATSAARGDERAPPQPHAQRTMEGRNAVCIRQGVYPIGVCEGKKIAVTQEISGSPLARYHQLVAIDVC